MKRPYLLISAALLGSGVFGFFISQYSVVTSDFPRAMALRSVIQELPADCTPLRLLDLFEIGVNRQNSWLAFSKLNWTQELIEINLRRYLVHAGAKEDDLAEKDLARAAVLRKGGLVVTPQDLELERQLATGLYRSKPNSPKSN